LAILSVEAYGWLRSESAGIQDISALSERSQVGYIGA